MGTVAMRDPPTDALKALQVETDGQQLSPGIQRHCADAEADVTDCSPNAKIAMTDKSFMTGCKSSA